MIKILSSHPQQCLRRGTHIVIHRGCFLLLLSSLYIASISAVACEIRVRDSAFRTSRDLHRLCVIADSSDPSAAVIEQRLGDWLDRSNESINLEVVRIDADDPETNWQTIGVPSAPPVLPVTVLVGRDNGIAESFLIDHWEPAPTNQQLASLLDLPARQALADKLARNVAVLVFAPRDSGASSAASAQLQSIIDAGLSEERIGLSMITVDRNDPAENLLSRFMGLRPDSPDTLCVAFGRGKLMSPPLLGDAINADNIGALVTQIRQACSCSKPLQTMGVDVPLVWSDEVDSTVILMDAELDLSQLDTEVRNMMAAKATAATVTEPTILPIPTGSHDVTPLGSAAIGVNRLDGARSLGIAACVVGLVAIIAFITRRRSSNVPSSD